MKIINRDRKGNVIKDLTKVILNEELSAEITELLIIGSNNYFERKGKLNENQTKRMVETASYEKAQGY